MANSPMWYCYVCDREFSSTLAAIEHKIRFSAADIWPHYGGDEEDVR